MLIIVQNRTGRAVARLKAFLGRAFALPDTSYEHDSNHCIALKKLLFNELPDQNLVLPSLPDAGYGPH